MNLHKTLKVLVIIAMACGSTYGLFYANHQYQTQARIQFALNWARQVAVEFDTLNRFARERTLPDPAGWSAEILNRSNENRIIQVTTVNETLSEEEIFELSSHGQDFIYYRAIKSGPADALKITLRLGYSGYLGAQNKLVNDALLAITFGALFLCLMTLLAPFAGMTSRRGRSVPVSPNSALELAITFRNLLTEAKELLVHVARSQKKILLLEQQNQEMAKQIQTLGVRDLKVLSDISSQQAQEIVHDVRKVFNHSQNFDRHIEKAHQTLASLLTQSKRNKKKTRSATQQL